MTGPTTSTRRARGVGMAHLFEGPEGWAEALVAHGLLTAGGGAAMSVTIVAAEAEARLDWLALTRALEEGHLRPRAEIGDTFLYRGGDTLLSRAAWIDGMGLLVKSATVFPGQRRPWGSVDQRRRQPVFRR
jgi:hypothetical protein